MAERSEAGPSNGGGASDPLFYLANMNIDGSDTYSDLLRPDDERDDDLDFTTEEETDYELDEEEDPIINQFKIYITPEHEGELYLLQFIGRPKYIHLRDPNNPKALHPKTRTFAVLDELTSMNQFTEDRHPTEIRFKPISGYMEVDIPMISLKKKYDRIKGVKYGEALKKTKNWGQTTYGIAAGFERKMPPAAKRRPRRARDAEDEEEDEEDEEDEDEEDEEDDDEDNDGEPKQSKKAFELEDLSQFVNNFEDAANKGHVMDKITWGGQILPRDKTKPHYFCGIFRKDELHLTPVAGIIQLRPELHHLDALDQIEIASKHKTAKTAKEVPPPTKRATTDEPSVTEMLKGNADEPWQYWKWGHYKGARAWEYKNKYLHFPNPEEAPPVEFEAVPDYIQRVLPRVVGSMDPKPKRKVKKRPIVIPDSESEADIKKPEPKGKAKEEPEPEPESVSEVDSKGKRRRPGRRFRTPGIGWRNVDLPVRSKNYAVDRCLLAVIWD